MIRRLYEKLLLRPEDVPPSRDDLEVIGAFNPGVVEFNGEVVLMVRVAERPREKRDGFVAIPWYDPASGFTITWARNEEFDLTDPRVVTHIETGLTMLTFVSHLRVVRSKDGRNIDRVDGPVFLPGAACESYGVEDPRPVLLDGRVYFTYVSVSAHGAATSLASTADFETFARHGIVFSPENKDVVLFPERIGGDYAALHRPNPRTHFSPPEMWFARSPDLVHWGQNVPFYGGKMLWEGGRVGAGAPPFRTPEGWLEIYHGNYRPTAQNPVGAYSTGAMLLDLEDPSRIVRQSRDPILMPERDYETEGFVAHVVFATGVVPRGDTILLYYGASDTYTAVVELSLDDVFKGLV